MELKVINPDNNSVANTLTVDEAIFAKEYNEALIHQVVMSYMANARSGTRAQKTRGEVSHSTKKPWRQKGTGRARAGMNSSPLWRGGGRIFPNRPDENFTQKINRKMYKAALASIMSRLVRDERLIVAENIKINAPKTREFVTLLKNMQLQDNKKLLVVVDELTDDLCLAVRNLQNVLLLETYQVDPYSLVRCDKTIFTSAALLQLQGQLQ